MRLDLEHLTSLDFVELREVSGSLGLQRIVRTVLQDVCVRTISHSQLCRGGDAWKPT